MTANSADAQRLWGYYGGDGGDGGDGAGNTLVRQAPNDAGPVVYSDFLFTASSGSIDATANGALLSYSFTLIPGTASASTNATANGVTLSYSYSLISGQAQASSQASGQTLTVQYSLLPGAAQASSTASGVTLSQSYSLIPGVASASSTASGVILPVTYSFLPGTASAGVSATAEGVTLLYSYILIPGEASGSAGDDQSKDPGAGGYVSARPYSHRDQKRKWRDEDRLAEELGAQLNRNIRRQKTLRKKLKVIVEDTRTPDVGGLLRTAAVIAAVPDRPSARAAADIIGQYKSLMREARVLEIQLKAIRGAQLQLQADIEAAQADEDAAIIALLLF